MKPTRQLHDLGQSLWLDNITRGILNDGTLQGYISELSVTGLTSNPTIFDHAFKNGDAYDAALAARLQREGTASFDVSWTDLLECLAAKQATLAQGHRAAASRP